MTQKKSLPGINIQWPWSRLIGTGAKTVETRSYPIPLHYLGVPLALIETPGPKGAKHAGIVSARIIGIVIFGDCFLYRNVDHWSKDIDRHLVPPGDPLFSFQEHKPKWGWVITSFKPLSQPLPAPSKRGIVFAKNCELVSV
jgi:hypothetical protein